MTFVNMVDQTVRLVRPLVDALRPACDDERVHANYTVVPEPDLGRTRTARLWTYVRDDRPFAGPTPPAALYRCSPDRVTSQFRLASAAQVDAVARGPPDAPL